jgi:protein TonB
MLNQLIESKEHTQENARRSGFLITTLGVLVAVLMSGWTYSLFAKNYGMGTGDLELSRLVAPVPVIDQTPPPKPEPERNPARDQATNNSERQTVIEKVARMEDSLNKPPKLEDSRKLDSVPLARNEANDYTESTQNNYRSRNPDSVEPGDSLRTTVAEVKDNEKPPEVVIKPSPKVEDAPKKPVTVSLGVVNGKATNLVKPPYPAAARAVRAEGAVNVQVLIDEQGNVVSATAVSGHPLLRAVSVAAARQSKFTPTLLSKQAVKVTGVIVYQFKPF